MRANMSDRNKWFKWNAVKNNSASQKPAQTTNRIAAFHAQPIRRCYQSQCQPITGKLQATARKRNLLVCIPLYKVSIDVLFLCFQCHFSFFKGTHLRWTLIPWKKVSRVNEILRWHTFVRMHFGFWWMCNVADTLVETLSWKLFIEKIS